MNAWRQIETGEIRPIWKIVIPQTLFWLMFFAVNSVFTLIPSLISLIQSSEIFRSFAITITYLAISIIAIGVFNISAICLDRRSFRDFGYALDRQWWKHVGGGLLLGAGLICAIFVTEYSLGWITISQGWQSTFGDMPMIVALFLAFSKAVFSAVWEETVFRAGMVPHIAKLLSNQSVPSPRCQWLAAAIPGFAFGFAHLTNPGASLGAAVAISIAGAYIALIYIHTGSLALPIAAHASWNFVQGNVFGFPVSGQTANQASIFVIEQRGPELWTGGPVGPEAGLLCMGFILLATICVFKLTKAKTIPALMPSQQIAMNRKNSE